MIRALDVAEEGGATGELLATFAQEAAEGVQRLTAAVHARDAEGVAHEAHALMGTAAMFGLPQLAATAGELEQAGVEGDLQAAAGLLDALNRDLTRGLEALASATGEASPEPGH